MKWLKAWRARRDCFHHNLNTGRSWISSTLIDGGSRKLFWCGKCRRKWVV